MAESYLEVQCWAVGAVEFPELTLNCLHRGLATSPVSAFTKSCATALDGVSGSNHLPRTRSRESQHAQGQKVEHGNLLVVGERLTVVL